MLDHRIVRRLLDVVRQAKRETSRPEFAQFWEPVLRRFSDIAEDGRRLQYDAIRSALAALTKYLGTSGPAQDIRKELQHRALGGVSVLLNEDELPGESSDPSTPLGYYRAISGIAQPERGYEAVFPYFLGELERAFQGPAFSIAYARGRGRAETRDAQAAVGAASAAIIGDVAPPVLAGLVNVITRAVDEVLAATPFMLLLNPQDYYQFAARFYRQGELDYFKCALTAGCVVPEEYYSEALYEAAGPGASLERELAPGSFAEAAMGGSRRCEEVVREATARPVGEEGSLNPYRPLYFDTALAQVQGGKGRMHILVDVERTGQRLRERVEFWTAQGKENQYLEDARRILALFLSSSHVAIHWVRSSESAWRAVLPEDPARAEFAAAAVPAPHLVSLLSDRICVYTSRGRLSSVNRGFWVDPRLLEHIEDVTEHGWERIPILLLGLKSLEGQHSDDPAERRYLLDRFVHQPMRTLFVQSARTVTAGQMYPDRQAGLIIDELLRPDVRRLVQPASDAFLTLSDLEEVFGRSYERLRHWVRDFNLGEYSVQAHDHRFTRESLERFVAVELSGKRGFKEEAVRGILERVQQVFARKM